MNTKNTNTKVETGYKTPKIWIRNLAKKICILFNEEYKRQEGVFIFESEDSARYFKKCYKEISLKYPNPNKHRIEIEQEIEKLLATIHKIQEKASPIVKPKNTEIDIKGLIPMSDLKYVPRKIAGVEDIKLLEKLYSHRKNLLLIGDTGTGKTHLIRHFCYLNKLPYKRINLNGATTPEDLVGQIVPTANGQFKWNDGWLTIFMRHGGVLVLDEINMANAEILAVLNSVIDDERTLTLTQYNGEIIHAHRDFWLVATMNYDYEGTKPLNEALKDRFHVLEVDYDLKVERKLGVSQQLIDIAKKLRQSYKSLKISTPTSTRALVEFVKDEQIFGRKLAIAFFINKYEPDDRPVVKEIFSLYEKANLDKEQEKDDNAKETEGED